MGAAESKLNFKNKVFRLAGSDTEPLISSHDDYWQMFWKEPESAEDIFNLLTFSDIKTIRDSNKSNFLNLIRIIVIKLIQLIKKFSITKKENNNDDDDDDDEKILIKELLNCIRILTKILPFLFEKPEFKQDLNNIFWNLNYNCLSFTKNSILNNNNNDDNESNGATIGSYSTDTNTSSNFSNISTKVNINQSINKSPNSIEVNIGGGETKGLKPLGEELIHSLIDLLFMRGFTLEESDIKGVDFKIWEVGIGSNGKYKNPNPKLDSNRFEVLRLILTLVSQGLYSYPKQIISNGSRFMTVLVSTIGRLKFLTFICSLLNLTCRSCKLDSDNNGLNYSESQYSNNKYISLRKNLITFSIQLLTSMIVYPIPSNDVKFLYSLNILNLNDKAHNLVRSYFGRLHKENEINFIFTSFINLLNKPMEQAVENELNPFNLLKTNFTSTGSPINNNINNSFNSTTTTGNSNLPPLSLWSTDIIILLWELIQCNKTFKNFVYNKKSPELMVLLLYYLKHYKNFELWKSSLIRIICYFMLYLTSNEIIMNKLLTPINSNYYYNQIPHFYKINTSSQPNNLTYRDFLIIQISNILINDEFDPIITPNFFEYLYNLIPIKEQDNPTVHYKTKSILSYHSSLSIINVVAKYNSSTILNNHLKLDLLALIVRAIAHSCCRFHRESRTLLYVLTKHESIFKNLLSIIESLQIDNELDDIKENENEDENFEDDDKSDSPESHGGDNDDIRSNITLNKNGGNYNNNNNNNEEDDDNDDDQFDNDSYKNKKNSYSSSKDEFEEILRPKPPVGMSSKAKSKLPIDAPLTKTWAGYKSLIIILKIIELVKNEIPNIQQTSKAEIVENLIKIESIKDYNFKISKFASSEFLSKTKFETLKFVWSGMSLGWYESILWGDIFYQNTIKDTSSNLAWFNKRSSGISNIKEVASNWGFNWKSSNSSNSYQFDNTILQLNIWNGSTIKLFKIRKPIMEKPLVDVNNLMKRLRLNSTSSITTLNTIDSRTSGMNGVNSPRHESISTFNSPNQLTPINSRQSFNNTPRNSIHINSRQNSFSNALENPFFTKQ